MHAANAKRAAPVRYTQNRCPGIGKGMFGDIGGMPGAKAGYTKCSKPKAAMQTERIMRPSSRTLSLPVVRNAFDWVPAKMNAAPLRPRSLGALINRLGRSPNMLRCAHVLPGP